MGEGVPLPLRIRFDELDRAQGLPNSQSAPFSEVWSHRAAGADELEDIVASWRAQRRLDAPEHPEAPHIEEADLPPPPPPAAKPSYQTLPPLATNPLARSTAAPAPPPPPAAPQLAAKPPSAGLQLRPGSLLNAIRKT